MLVLYDLDDNYITSFEKSKECAEYLGTSNKVIDTYICKSRQGKISKKRDKIRKRWIKIFRIEV